MRAKSLLEDYGDAHQTPLLYFGLQPESRLGEKCIERNALTLVNDASPGSPKVAPPAGAPMLQASEIRQP